MDHGGRLDKSSNLKFLKNQIFAQQAMIRNKIPMVSFLIFFHFEQFKKMNIWF